MALYKLCDCGAKSYFETRSSAPRACKECGRSLLQVSIVDDTAEPNVCESRLETMPDENEGFYYGLVPVNGDPEIVIPKEGGIVGRGALGADVLSGKMSTSREHINVAYRGRIGLQIEDISKYGTFVNGDRLVSGVPKVVHNGDTIKLYEYEVKVVKHDKGVVS